MRHKMLSSLSILWLSLFIPLALGFSKDDALRLPLLLSRSEKHASPHEFLQALLDDGQLAGSDVSLASLLNKPETVFDLDGSPSAIRFSSAHPSGLIIKPHVSSQCPWQHSACNSDEYTFKVKFYPEQISTEDHTHILSLITKDVKNKLWALKLYTTPSGFIAVDLNPVGSTIPSRSKPYLIKLDNRHWHPLAITVKLKTNEVQLTVDGKQQLVSLESFNEADHEQEERTGMEDFVGIMVGPVFDLESKIRSRGSYQLQAMQLETPDLPRRRTLRWRQNVLDSIPMNPVKTLSSLQFPENGFVQFEFRNRLRKNTDRESLTIEFDLPQGVTDGLIWFSENQAAKSYVYIKNSRLYYTYVVMDQTGPAHLTLTEEIFLNSTLEPNVLHVLNLVRQKDNLTLTLNQRSHASKSIDGRVPLIPSDGRVYLGGTASPGRDTDGNVATTFRGRISKAEVSRHGDPTLDLVQVSKDPYWKDLVHQSGTVHYEYQKPRTQLVIGPTASKPVRAGWAKVGGAMAMALSREAVPITFMGTQSSIVRFDTWDFTVYHSFEIEFRTFEPNGILFFVGPDREHTDFVCVELFDGNVYFVYAVGDHYGHIQLNPVGTKLNDGKAHRVYVSRNEQHKFLVKFNGAVVDVKQGTIAHQTEFATYTYIGSVDQPTRLPWHVWSRENFAGCITWIRVNDDKFLDASSRMSQHTDVSRGIRFGVCEAPLRQCTREKCGGGECAERSHPFFEPLNFACDCSESHKTFREGVMDIRRSETCFRDAPILKMDGDMVYMIDFERQMNTLTTHTDDISLQFRTSDQNTPLFYAVSSADRSYFRVDLVNGKIRVQTNINHPDDPNRSEQIYLNSYPLNDNQWHTLKIRRRADYIHISVDDRDEVTGEIPLISQFRTFKLVAQQIYLGSAGPENYQRPPPPGSDVKFLPPPPRFRGEFRNFYWNEYDFIGTDHLPSKYTTDMLTPRAVEPTFPEWPREPTYSITCTPNLRYGRLERLIDVKQGGDMWMVEFKTDYDGVIFSARDPRAPDQVQITLALIRGRLQLIYSIYGRSGVHEITAGEMNDGRWHRVVVGLDRRKNQFLLFIDNSAPIRIGSALPLDNVKELNFYFGGLPESEWRSVLGLIRTHAPTSLQYSEAENGNQPAFTGCLGGFSLRSDNFGTDLLRRYDSSLIANPSSEIVRGFCREQKRCSPTYCKHGRCEPFGDNQLRCVCTGTGYEGPRCENIILECPPNYCNQRGSCSMINGKPVCDCTGSGYHGERCELNPCTRGQYCYNGGRCVMRGNVAGCDCRGTGYHGDRCRDPICPPGYCQNGGVCRVDANERPVCDCRGTGYTGDRCQQQGCTPGLCDNGGQCRLNNYGQPECICAGTGFTGPYCRTPICTSDYCLNRGRCVVGEGDRPRCECRGTGYTGEKCHVPICKEGTCSNGGRCTVGPNDQPVCDCTGTGYGGAYCREPLCYPGFCQNNGRCVLSPAGQPMCTCEGTGFTGAHCQTPICSSSYCLNGGQCRVDRNDQPYCYCEGTGFHGTHCEIPICTPGYCLNGGRCTVQGRMPVCDCSGTGYQGVICNEQIACPPNYCLYGGICSVLSGNRYQCDCSRTARTGSQCGGSSNGIYVGYEKDGYFIYPVVPAVRTVEDNVTLGFKTYMQTGTLITFLTPDGQYWALKLRDGRVMVDVNGRGFYGFRMRSNDGHYHVLNVDRKGDTMLIRQNGEAVRVTLAEMVNPMDKSLVYNAIHIAADEKQSDIFRGVIGGVYWNGRYPINELKEGRASATGEVTIVLTPEFPISPPKPQPTCTPGYCLNSGRCYAENYVLKCDCSNTGWNGARCERQTRGFMPTSPGNAAYIIYSIIPPKRTTQDEMRVAFQTWSNNGPIARVVQADASYYDIVLADGRLFATFNGDQFVLISKPNQVFNDGQLHVVTVRRDNNQFNFTVDGHTSRHHATSVVGVDGSLITREIVLGADSQFQKTFDGVIGGFYWNGRYLINEVGTIVSDAQVMKGPGRNPADRMKEVVVVLMPHLLDRTTTKRPGPPKPLPDRLPDGAIAGGAVMPGLGTGNVNLGAPIFLPGKTIGGGGAGMSAGTGLMLKQAGGLLGMGGLIDALLAGLLLALLLLISALIWACWRCKPGCCAFCLGKSKAGRSSASAWDRLVAACCAAPPQKGPPLLPTVEDGYTSHDQMDAGRIVKTGYPGTQLDLSPQIDSTNIQIDQPVLTTDQNIYNLEGLKVDCVLITKNSKYFVTGSSMGPPKVWDAHSGEVFKIMDGMELGCTDLHLACEDSVLVTQVVDDVGEAVLDLNTVKVKRLQLWDFASGRQLEMPMEVMCTATCLTRTSEHVIVARTTPTGPSILVWNLPANQTDHEIPYHPMNQLVKDSVTYLNISMDDRLVVAGFQNPTDDQACYMVFDLSASYRGPVQPQIIQFDAEVNATEIISDDQAVTGTRRGELLVWNLHTGQVIRSIQISATLEGGNPTVLAPHTGTVHCVKLSHDRHYLVTGAQDQLVRVWTMPDERLLHTLEGHADDVLSVDISFDSEIVVSGSWDGSIRVWRLRDGNQICWFTSNIEILQVKISRDKRSLVALGERNKHRKLITLRVVRNRVRTTTTLRGGTSRMASSLSPPTPGMSPNSPVIMA